MTRAAPWDANVKRRLLSASHSTFRLNPVRHYRDPTFDAILRLYALPDGATGFSPYAEVVFRIWPSTGELGALALGACSNPKAPLRPFVDRLLEFLADNREPPFLRILVEEFCRRLTAPRPT